MYGKFNIQRDKPDIQFQYYHSKKKVMRAGEAEGDEEEEGKDV